MLDTKAIVVPNGLRGDWGAVIDDAENRFLQWLLAVADG